MSLASASLKVIASAKLDPPFEDNLTGRVTLAQTHSFDLSDNATAYAFRAIFSANAQTASLAVSSGIITLSGTGTQQVETCTITAAAGCTTSGNLTLTLTSDAVAGSPLPIEVPITTSAHTTAALIAAACVRKINTLDAVTSKFTVEANGADIVLTRIGGYANDATLNLAVTAELGVSAVASSTSTTSGVAGVIIERVGGNGNDVYGNDLPTMTGIRSLVISGTAAGSAYVLATVNSAAVLPAIYGGTVAAVADDSATVFGTGYPILLTASGEVYVDVWVTAV